jgi:SagB-type dehydrogenase family enzyme
MISDAVQYHWLTSYRRGRIPPHRLDWKNQPAFFHAFAGAPKLPLPDPVELLPRADFGEVSRGGGAAAEGLAAGVEPLPLLSALLLLSAAVTGRAHFAEGEIWYRSHPSAGALYPLEIYLSWPGSGDFPAGLYHYDIRRPALERIADPPGRPAGDSGLAEPELILGAVFARSVWKYRERAYRYILLDAGHLLENLRLALAGLGLQGELLAPAAVSVGEWRSGLAAEREGILARVRLPDFLSRCRPASVSGGVRPTTGPAAAGGVSENAAALATA